MRNSVKIVRKVLLSSAFLIELKSFTHIISYFFSASSRFTAYLLLASSSLETLGPCPRVLNAQGAAGPK